MDMNLRELVDPSWSSPTSTREAASGRCARWQNAGAEGAVPSADDLHAKLVEREQQGSTAIGNGVAIPHCKLPRLDRAVVAVGVAPGGVAIDTLDHQPVRLFFLVVSPESSPAAHLQSLAAIAKGSRAIATSSASAPPPPPTKSGPAWRTTA